MIIGKKEITDAFQKTAAVNMHDAVSKSIKTVQAEAKTRCPVNDGELRGSIYTAIETSSEKIVGICYTNKKWNLVQAPKVRSNTRGYHRMLPMPMYSRPGGSTKA